MKHLVLVGACYLDTILSVPHYPQEDSKLRATSRTVRRGGNCPNSLQVLQQLVDVGHGHGLRLYLVSCLPARDSPAARAMLDSFGADSPVDLSHCIYRQHHTEAASSYIIRSDDSGSRTLVNYNDLPDMTAPEFARIVSRFADVSADHQSWWHFEGRIPDTTLECMRLLRQSLPSATVSVEIEKPGRPGLLELAAEADAVFYSRAWAESRGHRTAEACLTREQRRQGSLGFCTWGAEGAVALSHSSEGCLYCPVAPRAGGIRAIDTVGAGDTFIGGMLYCLACKARAPRLADSLRFAVDLATLKVQREGFDGLAADVRATHGHDGLP